MAKYGFERGFMQSMFNAALCRAGIVTGLNDGETIPNGGLVYADNTTAPVQTVYGTVDLNLENFVRYSAAGSNGSAYIIDSADIPEVTDANGNIYKMGSDLTNLEFSSDKALRMRKLEVEDKVYIFDGNIVDTSAITVGYYLVPTDGSFQFTAQAAAPQSGLALRVMGILPLTSGLTAGGTKYYCKVTAL